MAKSYLRFPAEAFRTVCSEGRKKKQTLAFILDKKKFRTNVDGNPGHFRGGHRDDFEKHSILSLSEEEEKSDFSGSDNELTLVTNSAIVSWNYLCLGSCCHGLW